MVGVFVGLGLLGYVATVLPNAGNDPQPKAATPMATTSPDAPKESEGPCVPRTTWEGSVKAIEDLKHSTLAKNADSYTQFLFAYASEIERLSADVAPVDEVTAEKYARVAEYVKQAAYAWQDNQHAAAKAWIHHANRELDAANARFKARKEECRKHKS